MGVGGWIGVSTTGRDQVWALVIEEASRRESRGWLREISVATIAELASERELGVSRRTIRRVVGAMAETGVLERAGGNGETSLYRLADGVMPVSRNAATDLAMGSDVGPTTDLATGPRSSELSDGVGLDPDELLIYHLFADTGVEAEPLSAYGRVVRLGLDPDRTAFGSVLRGDATEPPLRAEADLVVLHPPCQRWSSLTTSNPAADREEHPDLIPRAREIGRELGEDYVIENVPQAPLEDPVRLEGSMFGLPVRYARAFETSFEVPEPPERPELVDRSGPFVNGDGQIGAFRGDGEIWRSVKQVSGDYPSEELKRSGIPAPYMHYLMRWFLRARGVE